jgi:hypothetical protein
MAATAVHFGPRPRSRLGAYFHPIRFPSCARAVHRAYTMRPQRACADPLDAVEQTMLQYNQGMWKSVPALGRAVQNITAESRKFDALAASASTR